MVSYFITAILSFYAAAIVIILGATALSFPFVVIYGILQDIKNKDKTIE